MKELYLIRHAKSDWNNDLPDYDRPLNERGLRNAPFMGRLLGDMGVKPQLVVSSPARRAHHTAQLLTAELGYPSDQIQLQPLFYEATTGTLQQLVATLPDTTDSIMFFGHNPAFTRLANLLAQDLELENLPTCGVVGLRFDALSWQQVPALRGEVILWEYPKKY